MMARGSRVAWSILERLGRFDGGSNPPYPIWTKDTSRGDFLLTILPLMVMLFYEKTGRCKNIFASL
jgi:hypothetical protein